MVLKAFIARQSMFPTFMEFIFISRELQKKQTGTE
jgi:hypothetical protein